MSITAAQLVSQLERMDPDSPVLLGHAPGPLAHVTETDNGIILDKCTQGTCCRTALAPLPGWDEMSGLDRGAALLHRHKRDWEGPEYAESDYPARYFNDPRLVALSPLAASRHAASLEVPGHLTADQLDPLYDAALDADRARP